MANRIESLCSPHNAAATSKTLQKLVTPVPVMNMTDLVVFMFFFLVNCIGEEGRAPTSWSRLYKTDLCFAMKKRVDVNKTSALWGGKPVSTPYYYFIPTLMLFRRLREFHSQSLM